jgi:hypothetical protein
MADIDVSKLIITEVDQITAFNNAGELEFIMDEIQDATISNTQEKTDITGKGGRKIGSLKKNKGVTISATNGVLVGGALAAQTGTEIEQGSFKVRKTEIATVSSNKATITGTPVGTTGNEIGYAYIKNANGSLGKKFTQDASASTGKFSFTGKDLTFETSEVPDGTEIVVFYDESVTSAKISNDSEKYSKTVKMYIDVVCQDNCDNQYHGQFLIQRADCNGEFEFTMGGDPTVHKLDADSLAGGCTGSTNLWDLVVY